jgi:hypothetical protein
VIDLLGLNAQEVRSRFPKVYQHLLETVKPERDRNNRSSYRDNWWLFGEPRRDLRPALADLKRYIATVETAKHRVFQFLDKSILPDNMLVAIALDDAYYLGVLSSHFHVVWSLAAGGTLEDRPRYSKSRCFDPFPFPEATTNLKKQIRALADELDALRKQVLADRSDLTLTAIYNVLEEIKGGLTLGKKSQEIKERGNVLILKDIHDQIDAAVALAYGCPADLDDDQILTHLVELNAERIAEERRGFGPLAHGADRVQTIATAGRNKTLRVFPSEEKAQAGEVLDLLARSRRPLTAEQIAVRFKNGDRAAAEIQDVLKSLDRIGQAETFDNGRSYFRPAT